MANVNPLEQALIAEGASEEVAALARAIQEQESGGNKNTKTSNAGAVGNMQVMPDTFNGLKDKGWDINNPLNNAQAGVRYITEGLKASKGDPALAAAYYYGGPNGMAKAAKGIAVNDRRNPKAPNTLEYAQQVTSRLPNGTSKSNVAVGTPINVPAPVQSPGLAPAAPMVIPEELALEMVPSQVASAGISMPEAPAINYGPDPWLAFQKALPGNKIAATETAEDYFAPKDWSSFLNMVKPAVRKADFKSFNKWGKKNG